MIVDPNTSYFDPRDPGDPGDPGDPWGGYLPAVRGCGPWFASVSYLTLSRDVPNNVELASLSGDPQTSVLNSERVGMGRWLSGIETRFGRAIGDRWAIEFDYWSLQAMHDRQSVRSDNNDINSRLDFQNLSYQGSPLSDIFDNSHEQRLARTWNVENIEINLLQQALVVDPSSRFGMTMFSGARYFRFDEHWLLEAAAANAEFADMDPNTQTNYWITVKNRMMGWQLGGRGHIQLGNRVRLFAMPRFGLFGNQISQHQHVCMIIDQHSQKTDIAFLGQLDLGLSIQVLRCCSVFGSYRALGIAGAATADDNVARTFTSPPMMESINSSSSLFLHGWQVGAQCQF